MQIYPIVSRDQLDERFLIGVSYTYKNKELVKDVIEEMKKDAGVKSFFKRVAIIFEYDNTSNNNSASIITTENEKHFKSFERFRIRVCLCPKTTFNSLECDLIYCTEDDTVPAGYLSNTTNADKLYKYPKFDFKPITIILTRDATGDATVRSVDLFTYYSIFGAYYLRNLVNNQSASEESDRIEIRDVISPMSRIDIRNKILNAHLAFILQKVICEGGVIFDEDQLGYIKDIYTFLFFENKSDLFLEHLGAQIMSFFTILMDASTIRPVKLGFPKNFMRKLCVPNIRMGPFDFQLSNAVEGTVKHKTFSVWQPTDCYDAEV